jgi:selenocysteine insertion sequence-binding protein 2
MSEINQPKVSNQRRNKPKKVVNLLDFVVIKKKNEKTQKIVNKRISAKPPKRGKVKRKKPTTLKKKIIKERQERGSDDKPETLPQVDELPQQLQELTINLNDDPIQHSRNFRDYCNHFITKEIIDLSTLVIKDLFRYQEQKFEKNPVKAKANRRYAVGFKEVKKFMVVQKIKLVFVAPDLERNSEVDKLVDEIKSLACEHKIHLVFSIKRRKLGYLLLKKVPVSILGVFDYQGTTENVNNLLQLVAAERVKYKNKILEKS